MLELILITSWVSFALYAAWYFTKAKHSVPLTVDEAKILWKIHRRNLHCNAKK